MVNLEKKNWKKLEMNDEKKYERMNEKNQILKKEVKIYFEKHGIEQKSSGMMFGIKKNGKQNDEKICFVQHDLLQHE
jgi:hypothetical protein